jgi:hypothetical protein
MTNSLIEIENISVIDLIKSESSFLPINQICYIDDSFDAGGFGSLHKVLSINGKQISGLVIKLISEEGASNHALSSITLLHKKLTKRLKAQKVSIAQAYPQLLGIPFCCFNSKDEINQKNFVGLLMYDLRDLGYEDFGSDKFNRVTFSNINIETKLYYSYQLSCVITLLHELEFIHSDLSENAIWINKDTENLLLIDYDSGYHFDSQVKPSTLGKVGHWIGSKFRKILSKESEKEDLDHEDRIAEENWVLANAIFELLFNVSPFFFLLDAADKTKQSYLKNNVWPNIEKNDSALNITNHDALKLIVSYIDLLKSNGLDNLINQFNSTFNKGFKSYKYRPKSSDWKDNLSDICKSLDLKPVAVKFNANKLTINSNDDPVKFSWLIKRTNYCIFNDKIDINYTNILCFDDSATVALELYNDFGVDKNSISITANKIEPKILKFYASKNLRDSIEPIMLHWETLNASMIQILNINSNLSETGNIEVAPETKTKYILQVIGNFGQEVKSDIDIDVIQPEIIKFIYEINIEKGIDNVDLFWESNNGISAEIFPNIGVVEPNGSISISIQDKTIFELNVKGYFGEVAIKMEAKPFPIPIIQSLFIPTPNFNLDTTFLSNNLFISDSFVPMEPINFDTSINFNDTSPQFVTLEKVLEQKDSQIPEPTFFNNLFAMIYTKLNSEKTKNEINEDVN